MHLTRRRVLGAGVVAVAGAAAGALGVWEGVLPGKLRLERAVGMGVVDRSAPGGAAGSVVFDAFHSARRGMTVRWGLATPPGTAPSGLPTVVVLHGRGDDARTAFAGMGLQHFLADHVRKGGRPVALVSVDGGQAYWHPRADGDDPLGMISDELVPLLRARGLAVARIGVLGWSMGGYGALLMARQSHRHALGSLTVAVAAAGSPALFASSGASAAGAFDDAADYRKWGRLAAAPDAGTVALMVSCGSSDPFADQTRTYRAAVQPTPAGGISAGFHEFGYWRSLVPAQLTYLSDHLQRA